MGLYDAVPPAVLRLSPELDRRAAAAEGADHGAVIDAFAAEIGTPYDMRLVRKHVRVFRPDAAERAIRLSLGFLRGDLHEKLRVIGLMR